MGVVRLFRLAALALIASVMTLACKDTDGTITVHRLVLNGVKSVDEGRLRDALATRQSTKIPWGKKAYFDRSRFDADLKRIQAFYSDRGYPDARVTGFDVKLNDKQDAVDLTVTIEEGAPVIVTAINYQGFDNVPPEHLAEIQSTSPIKVGQPRDRQLVITAHDAALNELKDHGYPYAKVTTNETNPNDDPKKSELTFVADPGTLAHFGKVNIIGNKSVDEHIIERQLTFKPGELFQRSLIQDSQRRLYAMELFQFVNIEPQSDDSQPEDVPTKVTVAEGNHQRVNFGVGYGTEEKARGEIEYHHLNFLGGARSAGVHARYSALDKGIRLDFNQPYFFAPKLSLGAEGQFWQTVTPAYNSLIQGGKATLTHRVSQRFSWSFSITGEHDSSSVSEEALNDPTLIKDLIALGLNPITGEQNGTLNSLGFDLQRTTADNVLDARHGYQIALHAEQAGRILPGSFQYSSVSGEGRHYLPIGTNLVLASRAQFGNIRPYGNLQSNVPFSKRYFLGGATSIRGWGRYEVSPLSGDGTPLGGASMFAFSEEARARLKGKLGGVVFVDGGNVWLTSWSIDFADLRYAIGAGLRYQTPIGPVRFDYGYQLNPIPGLLVDGSPQTRRWRVHFSIGQAF
ncbi:MAG TPA: outer membrane protein assembly factor BamA [Vicinamibacterales bacterium]